MCGALIPGSNFAGSLADLRIGLPDNLLFGWLGSLRMNWTRFHLHRTVTFLAPAKKRISTHRSAVTEGTSDGKVSVGFWRKGNWK